MNILFLSLENYDSLNIHGLYSDLLRQFVQHGDEVYLISPIERRMKDEGKRKSSSRRRCYNC